MKKKAAVCFAVIFATSLSGILYSQDMNEQHPGSKETEKCLSCHQEGIAPGNYTPVKSDISNACMECHERGASNHPIEIKPEFEVPSDLRLSADGELTCITCHKPHTPRFSDRSWQARSLAGRLGDSLFRKNQYKTYFLRRNNAHGELCLSCHGGL